MAFSNNTSLGYPSCSYAIAYHLFNCIGELRFTDRILKLFFLIQKQNHPCYIFTSCLYAMPSSPNCFTVPLMQLKGWCTVAQTETLCCQRQSIAEPQPHNKYCQKRMWSDEHSFSSGKKPAQQDSHINTEINSGKKYPSKGGHLFSPFYCYWKRLADLSWLLGHACLPQTERQCITCSKAQMPNLIIKCIKIENDLRETMYS